MAFNDGLARRYVEALKMESVREMDFTGRPLKGFVYVEPAGIETDVAPGSWIRRCERFVASLPPK
jgi:hypothetical protein